MKQKLEAIINPFLAPGRSLYIKDLKKQKTFAAFGANTVLPLASLAKVPLVFAWLEKERKPNWGHIGSLKKSAYPNILQGLNKEHVLSQEELASLSLLTSDNETASLIFDRLKKEEIQRSLEVLGMHNTDISASFRDADISLLLNKNLGPAKDIACMLEYLYSDGSDRSKKIVHWLKNNLRNSRIPRLLPDKVPVAHKTGSLEGLAHDAAIIYGYTDILLVVMTSQEQDTLQAEMEIAHMAQEIYSLLN